MSSADKCWECEKENVPLHNHHPVPRVREGTKTIPLCEECHSKAHHRKKNMDTSKLTKEGLKKTKENGTKLGNPKYGYNRDQKRTINENEMSIVRSIKEMRKANCTYKSIVERLEASGVVGRSGKPLKMNQVVLISKYDYGADLEEDNET